MSFLPNTWTAAARRQLCRSLLSWFDQHQRPLPWRTDRDPYRIWLSEVMLQQTTVAAVVPYFHRFLQAFPDVSSLAAAPESEVLRLWSGLGYYRRARSLHATAQKIVASHNGVFPSDPDAWLEFPGVGPYIRGAVLSQAFGCHLPIVEANSLRVLARWIALEEDPRTGNGLKTIWKASEQLLPKERVGDYNQALMELGSLVCTPLAPRCDECPVKRHCRAFAEGTVDRIPVPPRRKEVEAVNEVALVIQKGRKLLMVRRPDSVARWPGMWEIPHDRQGEGETLPTSAQRVARELLNLEIEAGKIVTTVRHSVTRYRITLTAVRCQAHKGTPRLSLHDEAKWFDLGGEIDFALASPQKKIVAALRTE